ncbi:hypothetical protein [Sphingomonas sp. LM7]|uniref:hypothetical protein n=1 Tax=Sphingomonas sp. LM7 TaxID=1938607 RepID=UPI000983D029|nr:hypothetical protein [Sphingomonas sp. LM7]AQR74427.1 hypothetical protein BXU08_12880 [Sphingomonas sp. LM7]
MSEDVPVALSCTWPRQPGLDFELWFSFSDDELTFGGDRWYADVFPLDDPENWERVCAAVDGLITGEARALLYYAVGRKQPYWTVLQLREADRWTNVSTGAGCAIPPLVKPRVLRNGHPVTMGPARLAWGSLLCLLLLLAAIWSLL